MKKAIRITALFLALLMLELPLVGCDRIDEMRAKHGTINDDGYITLNGETYILLNEVPYFSPFVKGNEYVYVTDKNVPVLLSEQYGKRFYQSHDGLLLMSGLPTEGSTNIYCRSDRYRFVNYPRIDEEDFVNYCFSYEEYNEDFSVKNTIVHMMTDEEKSAFEEAANAKKWNNIPINVNAYQKIYIWSCTDEVFFRRDEYAEVLLVSVDDCMLVRYPYGTDDEYMITYSPTGEVKEILDEMLKDFREVTFH